MRLPDYAGSAWRGVFGNSLKKLVCVTREPRCEPCLLYRNCVYPYIFETPPDPGVGKLRNYNAAPHPFVLCPGNTMRGHLASNTEHSLEVTLFGRGNLHLPYIIHALDRAAERGIGKRRGKLELIEIQRLSCDQSLIIYRPGESLQAHPAEYIKIPACPKQIKLRLITPLRIKSSGHLVTPQNFTFQSLFSSLLRRISLLSAFHSDTPLETDFAGLTRTAKTTVSVVDNVLRWQDWTRYSGRQHDLMQLGGLVGKVAFESDNLAPFWAYIWLGQWTHAGKNTSMGLGKYEIISTG